MKNFRLLLMMLLASVLSFTACDPADDGGNGVVPTVTLSLEEDSITDTSFIVNILTTNVERACGIVVPQGDATVTAANVLEVGVEIDVDFLNDDEPFMFLIAELEPSTAYDFYVAVENGDNQVLSEPLAVTTADPAPKFSKIIEFEPTVASGMSLAQMGHPGHYLTFVPSEDDYSTSMNLMIVDHSVDAASYQYLSGRSYPSVTGSFDGGSMPTVTAVVCDPAYSNFSIFDEETEEETVYTFLGEQGYDEDGVPYGVDVLTLMGQGEDNNMITFNLPAEDEDGNQVLIVGSYTGPLGYEVGPKSYPFSLNDWRFTSFKATKNGNTVTLLSQNGNGDFSIVLKTTDGTIANADGVLYTVENENLSGGYWDSLDDIDYEFTKGGFVLTTTDTAGTYKLEVGERRGWSMAAGNTAYEIEPEVYTITVTGL